VILNKERAQNLHVTVQLPHKVHSADLIGMNQRTDGAAVPDLSATSGITIQGATVNLDGTFASAAPYTISTSGAQLNCYVPATAAVLIRTT
jgi:hypothetical protein